MISQTFDMKAHEAKLDRVIAKSFSASLMANSKWRKLFLELAQPELQIDQLVWKFVGRDLPLRGVAPDSDCLRESHITDTSFADFPYKEIEWIEIPPTSIPLGSETVPFKHRPQNIQHVQAAIARVGEFDTALTATGFRVNGYRSGA
jgi:hypothetical protein